VPESVLKDAWPVEPGNKNKVNAVLAATDHLPRRLGVWTATATIVGLSIGSGILFPTQALLAVDSVPLIAKYLNHFVVTLTDMQQRLVAVALIAVIGGANYRSVSLAAVVQNLATSAKILALLGLAALIYFFGIFWTYEGAASICAIAGEVRSSTLIAADAMRSSVGERAADIISGLVMLSTFGAVAASALADPRVFFAAIGKTHARFATLHRAVVLITALSCLFVLSQTFDQLTHIFVIGMWPFYALAVAGIYVVRRRQPDLARPYRVQGYPFVPGVFIAAALLLVINAAIESPGETAKSMGWSLAGVPIYFLWRYGRRT
jgi:APA family basic amino acid/polyamine antiporter